MRSARKPFRCARAATRFQRADEQARIRSRSSAVAATV
jgi:hypothetical protein